MKASQVEQLIKDCQVENNRIRPQGLTGPTIELKNCIMVDALALRDKFLALADEDKDRLVAEQKMVRREK